MCLGSGGRNVVKWVHTCVCEGVTLNFSVYSCQAVNHSMQSPPKAPGLLSLGMMEIHMQLESQRLKKLLAHSPAGGMSQRQNEEVS